MWLVCASQLLLVVRMRVLVASNGHLATVPELGGCVEAEQQQTRHVDRRIACALDSHDTPYSLTHELVHCALVLEVLVHAHPPYELE